MSLLPILKSVAKQIVGLNINDANSRQEAVDLLNRAAKEIYESSDLVGCLREQVFYADLTDNYQITLPYYVEDIRGIRPYNGQYPLTLEQMSPKYMTNDWGAINKNWREKYRTPLETSLDSASHLKFTISAVMGVAVTINITGSTPTTDRITETVVIPAGQLTITTSNLWTNFPGLKVIRKEIITTTNVEIKNDAGTIVGHIANCELEASNLLVQVINPIVGCNGTSCGSTTPCASGVGCSCWEVLYKIKFIPFSGDFDEFPCSGYDQAIEWKARELWWADQEGKETRASLAFTKCNQILESRLADARKGIVTKAIFNKSKYSNLHYYDSRVLTSIGGCQ